MDWEAGFSYEVVNSDFWFWWDFMGGIEGKERVRLWYRWMVGVCSSSVGVFLRLCFLFSSSLSFRIDFYR